jgi:16S rRNA processing protein RimM
MAARSPSTSGMTTEERILVGRVARPHGNKGQVIVNPETDFPEHRFAAGRTVFVGDGNEPRTIVAARFHQGRPVIALEGVESMNDAEALAGAELKVTADDVVALPKGTYYHHDLIGCEVQDTEGRLIGQVAAVEGPLDASRLVVSAPHGEVLIPLAAEICVEIDPAAKRIRVAAPEGLIELNANR